MTDFHDDDSGFWDRNRSDLTIRVGRTKKKRDVNRTRSHRAITRDMERPADVPYDLDAEDDAPTTAMPRTRRRVGDTTSQRRAIRFDDGAYAALGNDVAADDAWHDFAEGVEIAVEQSAPLAARWQRGGGVRSIDPRVLSVGAIAIVATLLVPLFGSLSGNGSDPEMRAIVAAPASTEATTVPTTLATTTAPPAVAVDESDDDADDRPDKDDRDTERVPSQEEWDAANGETSSSSTSDASTDDDTDDADSGSNATSGSGGGSGNGPAAQGVLSAPASRVAAQCGNPYEVQAGDFWLSIAKEVGYSLDEFLAYNEADRDTPLYPGSVVCLPLGTSIAAETTTTEAPSTEPAATQPASTETAPTAAANSADSSGSSSSTEADSTTEAPSTQAPATTEAAPATTEEPAYEPPADIPNGGEVEQMIRDIWPDHLEEKALQIAWRESNFRPDVTSSIGCCLGVFQIHWPAHQSWLAGMGITERSQLFDARTNIRAAYALYQRSGGWGPWAMTNY